MLLTTGLRSAEPEASWSATSVVAIPYPSWSWSRVRSKYAMLVKPNFLLYVNS